MSPAGTVSRLFTPHDDPNADLTHRFASVFNWGEHSRGDWRLRVRDAKAGNAGVLNRYRMTVTGTAVPPVAGPLTLEAVGFSAEGFVLRATGPVGATVRLLVSSDLQDWTELDSGPLESGMGEFTDDTATGSPRFYRLMLAE